MSSSRWKHIVEIQILPWALDGLELGSNVLEVGPGYGATTDLLQDRVGSLTCVEIDHALACGSPKFHPDIRGDEIDCSQLF